MTRGLLREALAVLAVLAMVGLAGAHSVGLSQGTYWLADGHVTATLVFQNAELAAVLVTLDANRDGRLGDDETGAIAATGQPHLDVRAGDAVCTGGPTRAAIVAADGV